jgi:myo-inositol-1(or 4)-monophosphatase
VADATGVVVVGVILDPHRDELFHAVRGRGAFLNGAPMRVAGAAELRASLWGWGLHHARHVGKTMLRAADVFSDHVRGLRGLGSAAIEMAYVACGRLAGFFEFELCAWDLAAGSLLVEEAGGRVTGPAGQPYSLALRNVLATNGVAAIHEGAMALLEKAGATKADDPALWPPLHEK